MKKISLFSLLWFLLVFGAISSTDSKTAEAQSASFPPGCTSNLGYSATTGNTCNGRATATIMVPGCTTALGYSATTGDPCSGGSVAISYLAGCTSIFGYSDISGFPCNGTNTIAFAPGGTASGGVPPLIITGITPVYTPGLPRTGDGGEASTNLILLLSSLAVALGGSGYLAKKYLIKA